MPQNPCLDWLNLMVKSINLDWDPVKYLEYGFNIKNTDSGNNLIHVRKSSNCCCTALHLTKFVTWFCSVVQL